MKHKVCISISEPALLKIKENVRRGKYNNTSHAFESLVKEVLS